MGDLPRGEVAPLLPEPGDHLLLCPSDLDDADKDSEEDYEDPITVVVEKRFWLPRSTPENPHPALVPRPLLDSDKDKTGVFHHTFPTTSPSMVNALGGPVNPSSPELDEFQLATDNYLDDLHHQPRYSQYLEEPIFGARAYRRAHHHEPTLPLVHLHQPRPYPGPPLTQAPLPAIPTETNVVTKRTYTSKQAKATQPQAEEERQPFHLMEPTSVVPVRSNTAPPSSQQDLRADFSAFDPGPVQLHLVLALRPHVHLDEDQLLLHFRGTRTGLFGQVP